MPTSGWPRSSRRREPPDFSLPLHVKRLRRRICYRKLEEIVRRHAPDEWGRIAEALRPFRDLDFYAELCALSGELRISDELADLTKDDIATSADCGIIAAIDRRHILATITVNTRNERPKQRRRKIDWTRLINDLYPDTLPVWFPSPDDVARLGAFGLFALPFDYKSFYHSFPVEGGVRWGLN